jgi:hypothetical protein
MFHVKHFRRPFVGKNCTVDTGARRNTPFGSGNPQPRPLSTQTPFRRSILNTFAAEHSRFSFGENAGGKTRRRSGDAEVNSTAI